MTYAMKPLGCNPSHIKGHMDYGAKAATYVETFMAAIRWANVDRLFAAEAS